VLSAGSFRTRARRRMPVDDEHHDVMELL
jgi:hypothetical protein